MKVKKAAIIGTAAAVITVIAGIVMNIKENITVLNLGDCD